MEEKTRTVPQGTSRRRVALVALGTVAAAAGGVYLMRKPLTRLALSTAIDNSKYQQASASFLDTDACKVTAHSMEGPFYVPSSPLRSDVRDGQPGQLLRLGFKLVDAATCRPIAGAPVHIWHANAQGLYSGYPSHSPDEVELTPGHVPVENEERFLRGYQITDSQGRVDFVTIFPAWYSFRTPHIHLKALLGNNQAFTSQVYFPEELNTLIRETVAPYRSRPAPLVTNRSDPVIGRGRGAAGGWLKVARGKDGYSASLTIGVTRPQA